MWRSKAVIESVREWMTRVYDRVECKIEARARRGEEVFDSARQWEGE
jgi:hypothetical protein